MTCEPAGPFAAACPTRALLDQLADKWSVLVLIAVSDGPIRFNALRRAVEGVSQKMLAQTLRALERSGLVERTAFATVPVTVEYAITPLGRSLAAVVDQLRGWAVTHVHDVRAAHTRFDARVAVTRPSAPVASPVRAGDGAG